MAHHWNGRTVLTIDGASIPSDRILPRYRRSKLKSTLTILAAITLLLFNQAETAERAKCELVRCLVLVRLRQWRRNDVHLMAIEIHIVFINQVN